MFKAVARGVLVSSLFSVSASDSGYGHCNWDEEGFWSVEREHPRMPGSEYFLISIAYFSIPIDLLYLVGIELERIIRVDRAAIHEGEVLKRGEGGEPAGRERTEIKERVINHRCSKEKESERRAEGETGPARIGHGSNWTGPGCEFLS
ncbi:hypothetical protein NE237_011057 [Protea cynaroides]|uniref:Uncharacterized protein n=1 Tax=Protea cynaroides TaxID=273540 RepID=A0A9Q0JVH6_9MAGN|nr:hypothetical protein NE237_011057 [Protea cynaroides]